jgi:hypothetical protein
MRQAGIHRGHCACQLSPAQQVLAGTDFGLVCGNLGLRQRAARAMLHDTQQQRARTMRGCRTHPHAIDGLALHVGAWWCGSSGTIIQHGWLRYG